MFRIIMAAVALAIIALATACTDTQVAKTNATLDQYDHALDNFNTIVARVNQSIAKTDATVKPYCTQAIQVGTNVGKVVKNNSIALTALNTLTSGLTDYCTGPINSVGDAVVFLTQAIADGKAAISAGKGA